MVAWQGKFVGKNESVASGVNMYLASKTLLKQLKPIFQ